MAGVELDVARAAVKPSAALQPSDPNYAECFGYLTHGQSAGATFTTFQSQFGQDAYLYRNYFLGKASGFYLDVGANAPKELSNTWFFDKCLGWKGLCVEASPTRAQQLREQRSCKVVHACAWDAKKTLMLSGSDANSINDHLMPGGAVAVPCRTLDDILAEEGVGKIDLFSLDIESAEPQALRGMDVRRWAPDVVTVETFWLNQTFHNSMFDLGYAITGFVGPDTIYVRRAAPHVVNPEHMAWGRANIDNFRNEEQTRNGRCFDSIANPVRWGGEGGDWVQLLCVLCVARACPAPPPRALWCAAVCAGDSTPLPKIVCGGCACALLSLTNRIPPALHAPYYRGLAIFD